MHKNNFEIGGCHHKVRMADQATPEEQQPLLDELADLMGRDVLASLKNWTSQKNQREFDENVISVRKKIRELEKQLEKQIKDTAPEEDQVEKVRQMKELMGVMEGVVGTHYLCGDIVNTLLEDTQSSLWWNFWRLIDNSINANARMVTLSGTHAYGKFNTSIKNYQRQISEIDKNEELSMEDKNAAYLDLARGVDLDSLMEISAECAKQFAPFQKYHWKRLGMVLGALMAIITVIAGAFKWLLPRIWPENN